MVQELESLFGFKLSFVVYEKSFSGSTDIAVNPVFYFEDGTVIFYPTTGTFNVLPEATLLAAYPAAVSVDDGRIHDILV
jgi:hypothetical protein